MNTEANEILQKKNQAFLDNVCNVVGSDYNISHQITTAQTLAWTNEVAYCENKVSVMLNFTVQTIDSDGDRYAKVFSHTHSNPVKLNDEIFDRILDYCRSMFSEKHYVTLKGRKTLEFAKQLQDSLISMHQDSAVVDKKKMKI